MASTRNRLTDKRVNSLKAPGVYSDGGGLYLRVYETGGKAWIVIKTPNGKRDVRKLGSADAISLAEARALLNGPKKKDKAAPTFGAFSTELIDGLESGWRNEKHRQQWRNSLRDHAKKLNKIPVDEIDTDDVLAVLRPIWGKVPETADRVRGRIERVLNAAKAQGHITVPWNNPAVWRGHLDALLPKRKKLARGHHAAMEYQRLPAFVTELRKREATAARALEFLILCASRTGEVIGALKSEINRDEKTWTIPAERMKAGREHTIVLTERAMAIVAEMWELDSPYLFPSPVKADAPLSNMAMETVLRRMGEETVTVHGFRSTFKDWSSNETDFADELSEEALAHIVGSKVRRAYRRGEALERRRKLMEAWAGFVG